MNDRAKNILVSNYGYQDIDLLMVDLLNRLDDKEPLDADGNFTSEALVVVLEGDLSKKRGRDLAIRNRVYEVAENMLCRLMSEDAVLFDQMLYQITEPTFCVLSATGSAVSKERIEALVEVSCLDLFGRIS